MIQDMKGKFAGSPLPLRWGLAVLLTFLVVELFQAVSMPAAQLLGAMVVGIAVAVNGGRLALPATAMLFSQSIIGCLVARSIRPDVFADIGEKWPVYLGMVLSMLAVSVVLGWALAKKRILPGTTAVWGSLPGAAPIMIFMSAEYGADFRLVSVMQYSRVLMVTFAASLAARAWGEPLPAAAQAGAAGHDHAALAWSLVLCLLGTGAARWLRVPSLAILIPLVLGTGGRVAGLADVGVPWWLLTASYAAIGWGIGFRFTREILAHAVKVLPAVAVSFAVMIAACAAIGLALGGLAGIGPLTAFLATSPGGMDAVAIIAVSIGGDTSFVMAVQTLRFVVMLLAGPSLASFIARRIGAAREA